ncbi:MAG: hypothetical protein STSR0008_11600 [Ignavibacterium sp.]
MNMKNDLEIFKNNLAQIDSLLENLNDENFFSNFDEINILSNEAKQIYIKNQNIKIYFSELNTIKNEYTKLIGKKLDNVISKKQIELEITSKKLNELNNQKKLNNYK